MTNTLVFESPWRTFLIVGLYDPSDDACTRWAEEFRATTPEEAEAMARETSDHLRIAGVIELQDGRMVVVA